MFVPASFWSLSKYFTFDFTGSLFNGWVGVNFAYNVLHLPKRTWTYAKRGFLSINIIVHSLGDESLSGFGVDLVPLD